MTQQSATGKWLEIITPRHGIFKLDLREIWAYRDLLLIFTRRDILAVYKQTILGPLWFILQPIITTVTFVLIFSRAAKFPTLGIPPVLFYLSGLVLWSFFAECLNRTSGFFKDNQQILSKVYFPRLIIPLSLILTNLVKFAIQLSVFFVVYLFMVSGKANGIAPNGYAFLLPLFVIMASGLGMAMGIIISSLTSKYKDLAHLTAFGVQIMMFASPVIFPVQNFSHGTLQTLIKLNPMTGVIEAFRFGFMGKGYFSWTLLGYDIALMAVLLGLGVITFNAVERQAVDNL